MAKTKEITVNGVVTEVTEFDHSAQEIDDATARALAGGAIDQLLAGKAPDGYGLGSVGRTVTDLDDAMVSGFYSAVGAANIPSNIVSAQYAHVLVLALGTGRVTQVYFHCVTGGTGAIAVRRLDGNGWSPWEFINPPMVIDVEYRTTERYNGKSVYVKTINFGALPNASSKNVSIGSSGIETMISTIGNMKRPSFDESYTLPYLNPDNFVGLVANNGSVTVYSTSDWSNWNATVTVKYTKTTD